MTEPILQSRDREVLRAVVDSFIQTGEPVGSRTISREYREALSPATIRNVMADLEESGLLSQPHPSAGRVPTDRGLRFYVEELLPARPVPAEERRQIEHTLRHASGEIGALLEQASVLLAGLSHNVGMVLVPEFSERTIETIAFVRVGFRRITALVVSRPGMVHHRMIEVDQDYSQDELGRISRYLSESFQGLSLRQIRPKLIAMMSEEKALYDRLMREALDLSARSLAHEDEGKDLIVEGAANILDAAGVADVEKMRALFHAFEEKSRLVTLLNRCLDERGCRLFIGAETGSPAMAGCSLVASPYHDGTRPLGTIGVLGPARMEYGRAIAVVETLARVLSEVLTEGDAARDGSARRASE